MIEDDDSFIQQEGLPKTQEDEERQARGMHALVGYIVVLVVWIIWTVACILFFSQRVEQAVRDSGVLDMMAEMTDVQACSRGICYVDLSREILDSPALGEYTAFDQIADSLMLDDDVDKVVFLVEGERLDALD